jgi:hypothetical protein
MSSNRNRANQQNATLSTGPRTKRGKRASRNNAMKHGLRAQQVVILDENPKDFEALHTSLRESFNPNGTYQESLVQRITICFWRLLRIPKLEAGILEYQKLCEELSSVSRKIDQEIQLNDYSDTYTDPEATLPQDLIDHETRLRNELSKGVSAYGEAFDRFIQSNGAFEKLMRYESHLSRELYRALSQLEHEQARAHVVDVTKSAKQA